MYALRAILIAGTALAVSAPASAGRYQDEIMRQDRAAKRLHTQQQGLAGPVGEQGRVGPVSKSTPRAWSRGHPTERVRR